jgi:YbgC/YbaW family acyl-CoA thioester hydrolase
MELSMPINVSPNDTDELGHLNHVKALALLEAARLEWYSTCGLLGTSTPEVFGTIVVNINVNYRRECFSGEKLYIRTSLASVGRKSFCLAQKIMRSDGEIAIDGMTTSVVMKLKSRKIIPVPDCISRNLDADVN